MAGVIRGLLFRLCACNHDYTEHVAGRYKRFEPHRNCSKCPCVAFTEDNIQWLLDNEKKKEKKKSKSHNRQTA